jgi:hypothetical protein
MKIHPLLGFLLLAPSLQAAVPLTGSSTFTENFNLLPATLVQEWIDNTTRPHWYLHRSNAAAPFPVSLLINDNNAATAWSAGIYSLGATNSTDRALGSAPTGTLGEISFILTAQNTSALPIQITGINYTVEKWRENSTAGIAERIAFSWQKAPDESSLTSNFTGTWTASPTLDTAIPHSGTAGAINNPGLAFSIAQSPNPPIILEPGEVAGLRWLNANEIGSDAYLGIDDVRITWVTIDGAINSVPGNIVRDTKSTANPADDTFSFTLPVSGVGTVSPGGWILTSPLPAGWTGPASGSYGDEAVYSNIPVNAATVTLTLRDSATASITRTITVATPPVPAVLTPTSVPMEVRFAAATPGSNSFTRSYTDGLTDLSWTSNAPVNAFNGVSSRPGGGDPNQYFRIRNARLNRFQTEAVDISNVAGFDVSMQLATYTTSASGFEDLPANAPVFGTSDRLQVVVEASVDGVTWTNATPSLVSSGQTALSQFDEFKIGPTGTGYTADNITPSTLPDIIPFVTRSLRFTRGTANFVRLSVLGGNDSDTENTLFDNIRFGAIPPAITAALSNVIRNNQGDDNAANDTFTFSIAVNNDDMGRPLGWTSTVPDYSGAYSTTPIPFPVYPVSEGTRTILFTDAANPSVTLSFNVPVPTGVLTASAPAVVRLEGATPDPADDTWTFTTTVSAVNGGTGFTNSLTADSLDYSTAITLGPWPVSDGPRTVLFRDRSDAAWTTSLTVNPPIRPVLATYSTGGPAGVLYQSAGPAITGWTPGASQGILNQVNGGGTVPHVLRSDLLDLSSVNGAVRFLADFAAIESSAGTNFEANDTFKIELDLASPSGTTLVNLIDAAFDTGDGAASTQANGPPNGILNGFTGLADTAAGLTAVQDYDNNVDRDEFNLPVNSVRATAAGSFTSLFRFSRLIPDDVTAARIIVTGLNNSASESFILSNMRFFLETSDPTDNDGDGATNGQEITAGTDPDNPHDVLRLAPLGAIPGSDPPAFLSRFASKNGRFYRLYRSADLQTWTTEGMTYEGDGGEFEVSITLPSGAPRNYYRLMVSPVNNFPPTTP